MPRSLLVRLLALLCAATLGVPAVAQAPAPAKPQAPPPSAAPPGGTGQNRQEPTVLRVTTRLVQVNVIVQGKKGEPVGDLTQGDFTLLDQGESQTISTFSMESTRVLPARVQPLPANFFTNRYEQKGGAPTSVTVILLDGLNTKFEDMAYARQQIVKFLGQLQPQDRVGLYTLTTRLSILHDFTSDAAPLLRALARFKGHAGTELAASEPEPAADTGNNLIDDFLNAANQRMSDFYTINRARSTADALEAIANHVAGLPGRKNLIWVSG